MKLINKFLKSRQHKFLGTVLTILIFALIIQFSQNFFIHLKSVKENNLAKSSLTNLNSQKTSRPLKAASVSASPAPRSGLYRPFFSGNSLRVPILMYHYIGNNPNSADKERYVLSVPPDKFAEQMKYLSQNGYHTISLDTLYAALKKQVSLPPKPVILSFDDGYEDFFYNAFPILLQYRIRAVSFIPTGLMNQGYYLSWSQIRQMQASGLVSFEAHSVHHYNMTNLSDAALKAEVVDSKNILQQEVGVPVNFFAYPYGAYNTRVIQAVKQAGFVGSAATWAGKIQSEGTLYAMPRLRVGGGVDLNYFKSLL